MCGIAGIIASARLDPGDPARVERMRDVLAHRGPDDQGLYVDGQAALGHRRLSIVDLAAGHQPLANENGTVWVTYNGEIYNHADVRLELEARGHRYRTRCDTETIVHAYEEWGDDCVQRFRGMFAFALWDGVRRRALLARDRLGVKPLYWTLEGERLLFGSEIKAILASGLIRREIDRRALAELLAARYTSGDDTLFAGIRKLMPGHLLVYEGGRVTIRRWWDVPVGDPAADPIAPSAVVPRFRSLLEHAVRLRLMSDVPLGVFLSGGLDSSVIAALMARQIDRPLETFSVAFEERAFSELAYSRAVARAIGARPHEVVVGAADFFRVLPRLVWHEDEPMAHPSSVPLYFVSRLAGGHVKVVLTGEGADELLAGYGRYPRTLINWRVGGLYARAVPAPLRRGIAGLVSRLPARAGRIAGRSFLARPCTPEAMAFDAFAAVPLAQLARLCPDLAPHGASVYGAARRFFDAPAANASLLDRLLYADLKTYLVELLMKQDQMSMAASIESRVPFLDHALVEFAARLPAAWKLRGLTTKRVLREAARDLLPRAVLERPKMGFPVPFAAWVRGPWHGLVRDVLLDTRARQRGITDPAAVAALLDRHRRGAPGGAEAIWMLLNLELWCRIFVDGSAPEPLPAPAPAAARTAVSLACASSG
ncbi:MAG TPA: asparagine synthase (glutamine-hydrolyzing) [Vicinamibacterales bacterium]|nr:asparagine synthase (glutamine-hydrolyzing) [Vicinamibacterales bacterium]